MDDYGGDSDRSASSSSGGEDYIESYRRYMAKRRKTATAPTMADGYIDERDEGYDKEVNVDGATAPSFSSVGDDEKEGDDDSVESMMTWLTRERELGKFHQLREPFVSRARNIQRRRAGDRVPYSGCTMLAKPGSALELRLGDANGPTLATGYTRPPVTDAYDHYAEFTMAQLAPGMAEQLQEQMRDMLAVDYKWTLFKAPGNICIYYADTVNPFRQLQQQQQNQQQEQKSGAEALEKSKREIATQLAKQGQRTMNDFFKTTHTPDAQKVVTTAAAPTIKRQSRNRKHSEFSRGVFYASAITSVVAVPPGTPRAAPQLQRQVQQKQKRRAQWHRR
jgi:hypothetical protein